MALDEEDVPLKPPTPIQQLVPPDWDPLFQTMRAAYAGDARIWRRVTLSLRDSIVEYARRESPYYRERLRAVSRFEEIPILTKDIIREHLSKMIVPAVAEERRLPRNGGGGGGNPALFFRDRGQQLAESSSSDRFFRWLHRVPLDATIVTVLEPVRATEPLSVLGRFVERTRARRAGLPARDPWLSPAPVDTPPRDVPRHIRAWRRFRHTFLMGRAEGLDWLADQVERRGIELRKAPVAIATTSGPPSESSRARIERVFGCRVHGRYGPPKLPWLAASLPGTTDAYAFNPFIGHVEVVDADGAPCPPGAPGRILLTDVNNRVMPLLRYEVGETGTLSVRDDGGPFPIVQGLES